EAARTLDRLAQLAQVRKGEIRIEGHTDNVGSPAFNRVLSELRAHVVALALARRGVKATRLQPRGWGDSRPVAPNDSAKNRAKNRRVEVIFTPLRAH
ncbi:MAG: OmpA family protein, partial [Gammaproteobacteria bacterium]